MSIARITLFVVMLAFLLAGCVTIVVPTATPGHTPLPSPVLQHGEGGYHDPTVFDLAAGGYVVSWMVSGDGCLVNLRLQGLEGVTYSANLASQVTTAGPMASPVAVPPLAAVPAGTYAILAITACPWVVALAQYK